MSGRQVIPLERTLWGSLSPASSDVTSLAWEPREMGLYLSKTWTELTAELGSTRPEKDTVWF